MALIAKAISKAFGERKVLDQVSLSLPRGRITVLLGPSGSGKSTLLSCMAGIMPLDNGKVEWDGSDIFQTKDAGLRAFWPEITAVEQYNSLWPHLTNWQNISLSKHFGGVKLAEAFARKLGVDGLLRKYPHQCSGGEQQRIAILRQLVLQPKYLLLDEITSALDLELVDAVSSVLEELKVDNVGIMINTHSLSLAFNIGDYYYFLDHGKIVESGEINQLQNPQSERLKRILSFYDLK